MSTCPHTDTEPVEVRDPLDAGTGPVVEVVARVCLKCHVELPAAWGCTDCEWLGVRALCEASPILFLAHPCEAHR